MRFLFLTLGLFLLSFEVAPAATKLAGTYDGPGTFSLGTSGTFSARVQVAIFNDATMMARTYSGANTSALFYGFIKGNGVVTGRYIVDGTTQAITGSINAKGSSYIFVFVYQTLQGNVTVKVTMKKQQ